MNYKGTLLVVSHDREFLDNVVTSSYVLAGDGEVRTCAGGYAEAARLLRRVRESAAPHVPAATRSLAPNLPTAPARPAKLTFNEKRELDALPDKIAALEQEIADMESALADPAIYANDSARAKSLTARLPLAREELDAMETRWLELSERE